MGASPHPSILAAAGSLLAHAALLVASAWADPPPAEPAPRPEEKPRGPSLFVMHPTLDVVWSPPPALEACFDARVIEATGERYQILWAEIRAWAPIRVETWQELETVIYDRRGEIRRFYLQEQAVTCAMAAGYAQGRLVLEVGKRRDGSTRVHVRGVVGAEREDELHCCLNHAAESLLPSLGPGEMLRYESWHGATLHFTPER